MLKTAWLNAYRRISVVVYPSYCLCVLQSDVRSLIFQGTCPNLLIITPGASQKPATITYPLTYTGELQKFDL